MWRVCGHLPEEFEGNSAGAGHHEVGDEEEGLLGQGGGQQGDDGGRVVDEVGQHREQRRTDRRHQEHVEEQEHRVGRHRPPLHVRMRVQPSTPVSCALERECVRVRWCVCACACGGAWLSGTFCRRT